ncbi:MAG: hypothetical protein ABIS69_09675 [Sediminibacterium sp.]
MNYKFLVAVSLFIVCNSIRAQKVNTSKVVVDAERQTKTMHAEIAGQEALVKVSRKGAK